MLGVSRSISWWTGKGTGKGGHGIDWKGNRERWTWHRLEREQGKVDMASFFEREGGREKKGERERGVKKKKEKRRSLHSLIADIAR